MELNRRQRPRPILPNTTVVLASDLLDPGLKASIYGRFFRGLKAPAPSESPIYNYRDRMILSFSGPKIGILGHHGLDGTASWSIEPPPPLFCREIPCFL